MLTTGLVVAFIPIAMHYAASTSATPRRRRLHVGVA